MPLGPAKRRSLLAMLLLRANVAVSVDTLTEALWDDEPPLRARTVIQGHVSRLRALLAGVDASAYGVELSTRGAAYHLELPETLLDAHRFEGLVALARRATDPGDRAALLTEALALWQGPALAGAYPSPLLRSAAHTLDEARLAAVELLADTYVVGGEHERAVQLLRPETGAHPLREPLAARLVEALHHAGRSSEALDAYHRARHVLADELGVRPGAELTAAFTLALGSDSAPEVRADAPRPALEPMQGRPNLLPRTPRGFHGRTVESAALTAAAAGPDGPVVVVTGPAGVGKTALAVHWAAGRRSDFPDGTLYADLRGFSDTSDPEPAELLREFLVALDVPPCRMPESADAAGALFRSLTAELHLLVVLDNARTSAQVRPLLPTGPGCVTVVTSRARLTGLVASDAARVVALDVLATDDSVALLARVLGEHRTAAEPQAARRTAELCGGLPLALRVAAARLVELPALGLASLADRLTDERQRLALLAAEDIGVASALRLTTAPSPLTQRGCSLRSAITPAHTSTGSAPLRSLARPRRMRPAPSIAWSPRTYSPRPPPAATSCTIWSGSTRVARARTRPPVPRPGCACTTTAWRPRCPHPRPRNPAGSPPSYNPTIFGSRPPCGTSPAARRRSAGSPPNATTSP
ncbi:BTAD domain-containing putative transcriptional regulator [Kitasatospora sp. NPDC093550]|uniref:AfsR/SARP family transcriptional regulator n=1 Tax=Kitasatospora sp. NPDC093550 TaxID=3364089 RepID=UPI003805616D